MSVSEAEACSEGGAKWTTSVPSTFSHHHVAMASYYHGFGLVCEGFIEKNSTQFTWVLLFQFPFEGDEAQARALFLAEALQAFGEPMTEQCFSCWLLKTQPSASGIHPFQNLYHSPLLHQAVFLGKVLFKMTPGQLTYLLSPWKYHTYYSLTVGTQNGPAGLLPQAETQDTAIWVIMWPLKATSNVPGSEKIIPPCLSDRVGVRNRKLKDNYSGETLTYPTFSFC